MIVWEKLVKLETVKEQEKRINRTDWQTILDYLLSPASEIAQIILVNREADLPRVAAFFVNPQIDDNTDTVRLMQEFKQTQTFALVFNRNKIEQIDLRRAQIVGENVSRIAARHRASCIFAPPCCIARLVDAENLIAAFQASNSEV